MNNTTAPQQTQYFIRNENTRYRIKLFRIVQFELNSFIGRKFFNRRFKAHSQDLMLNLGGGGKPAQSKGWINADFFPCFIGRNMFKCLRAGNRADWMLDLRYPLNCEDEIWSGIFTSHTIEHLYYDQAFCVLKEIHRTLKAGSWIRIVVPDLGKYIQYYNHRNDMPGFEQYKYGAEAIHNLTQNFMHLSVWDYDLLGAMLREAGFQNVSMASHSSGSDSRLLLDIQSREWESLYVEAQKISV